MTNRLHFGACDFAPSSWWAMLSPRQQTLTSWSRNSGWLFLFQGSSAPCPVTLLLLWNHLHSYLRILPYRVVAKPFSLSSWAAGMRDHRFRIECDWWPPLLAACLWGLACMFLSMCITGVWILAHAHTWATTCGRQRRTLAVFLTCSPPYILRQGLLLSSELPLIQLRESPASPPAQFWDWCGLPNPPAVLYLFRALLFRVSASCFLSQNISLMGQVFFLVY